MVGGKTKFAILSLLRLGPLTGAEIRELCQTRFNQFWSESYGQIYPTLSALCKTGLIKKLTSDGKKKSIKYELMQPGRDLLQNWVEAPSNDRLVRDEFILKLFSGSLADTFTLANNVQHAIVQNTNKLAEIEIGKEKLHEMEGGSADAPYWALVLRAGELIAKARQQWLEEIQEQILLQEIKD